MKKNDLPVKLIMPFALAVLLLTTACQQKENNEAKKLLQKAQTAYSEERYDEAIATIEQLRHDHPEAIDERRAALTLFQNVSLKQAQADLAHTDSLLQKVNQRHQTLQQQMKQNPYSKELERNLTQARQLRDSLQIRWSALGAKIRLIHKRQEDMR